MLAQTYSRWELVIVDDGSTDGSSGDLRAFARSDARVRYIRHANRGLAFSRNAGVRIAAGLYVTFLDSDDAYEPDHLERRMRYLLRHSDLDGVYGGIKAVGPRSRAFVPDVDHPGRKIHIARCHAAGTLVVRLSALVRIGGFRPIEFSEDYDLIRRLEGHFRLRRVSMRTYLYHLDAGDRLCDLYAREGSGGILRYRRRERQRVGVSPRRGGGARSPRPPR